jgi:hypothetical protein
LRLLNFATVMTAWVATGCPVAGQIVITLGIPASQFAVRGRFKKKAAPTAPPSIGITPNGWKTLPKLAS